MPECSKKAHITVSSHNRHTLYLATKLSNLVNVGPFINCFTDDFYRLYQTIRERPYNLNNKGQFFKLIEPDDNYSCGFIFFKTVLYTNILNTYLFH